MRLTYSTQSTTITANLTLKNLKSILILNSFSGVQESKLGTFSLTCRRAFLSSRHKPQLQITKASDRICRSSKDEQGKKRGRLQPKYYSLLRTFTVMASIFTWICDKIGWVWLILLPSFYSHHRHSPTASFNFAFWSSNVIMHQEPMQYNNWRTGQSKLSHLHSWFISSTNFRKAQFTFVIISFNPPVFRQRQPRKEWNSML
jgi:hypothetical protein